jgi:GGDEF domain-containing protein
MVVAVGRECTGEEILSLSVGAAFFPSDGADTEDLLAEADKRMYQMKQLHRADRTRGIALDDLSDLPLGSKAVQ